MKQIYTPMIDVITSVIPDAQGSEEEYKGYHQKQMSVWKMEKIQSRRGVSTSNMMEQYFTA